MEKENNVVTLYFADALRPDGSRCTLPYACPNIEMARLGIANSIGPNANEFSAARIIAVSGTVVEEFDPRVTMAAVLANLTASQKVPKKPWWKIW